jgi:hypothetical protein
MRYLGSSWKYAVANIAGWLFGIFFLFELSIDVQLSNLELDSEVY